MLSNRFYKDSEGTVHEVNVAEAVDKAKPMRPLARWDGNETVIECASCKEYPFDMGEHEWARMFCGKCGQAQDWSWVK